METRTKQFRGGVCHIISRDQANDNVKKQCATISNAVPAALRPQGSVNFAVYSLAILFIEEAGMARLTKWGNSQGGLRLPKTLIEAAGLRVGDEVICRLLDNGTILLTPLRVVAEAQMITAVAAPSPPARW
jgi:antitoxin component of MazEF toxin-antitoxin module